MIADLRRALDDVLPGPISARGLLLLLTVGLLAASVGCSQVGASEECRAAIRAAERNIDDAAESLIDAIDRLTGLERSSEPGYLLISAEHILDLRSGYHQLFDEGIDHAFRSALPESCR